MNKQVQNKGIFTKKRLRRAGISVAVVLVVLLSGHLFMMKYAASVLRSILDESITKESEGLYNTSFSDITVNLWDNSLHVENFFLSPDTVVVQKFEDKNLVLPTTADLKVSRLQLSGIKLFRAFFTGNLEVDTILLHSPDIRIKLDRSDNDKIIKEINIYKLISPVAKSLQIQEIRLKGGKVTVNQVFDNKVNETSLQIDKISFINFRIDSLLYEQPKYMLHSKAIDVSFRNFYNVLSDSSYKVSVKSFGLNTLHKQVFLHGIDISPLKKPVAGKRNFYDIYIPEVKASWIDLHKLSVEKELSIKDVLVENPKIRLINIAKKRTLNKEAFELDSLYNLMSHQLNLVDIENINIRGGFLRITKSVADTSNSFYTDIDGATLRNVRIDSNSASDPNKIFFADNVRAKVKNYFLRLSDDLHLFKARYASFSSDSSEFSAKDISVEPRHFRSKDKDFYIGQAPELKVSGIDLRKGYNENKLDIDKFWVRSPRFHFHNNKRTQEKADSSVIENKAYALVSELIRSISIKEIQLDSGFVKVHNYDGPGGSNFSAGISRANLENFNLDSLSSLNPKNIFYADNFRLLIRDYKIRLPDKVHNIYAKNIGISTFDQKIWLNNVELRPTGYAFPYENLKTSALNSVFSMKVPNIVFNNVNLLKAYFERNLDINDVLIRNPDIHIGAYVEEDKERRKVDKQAVYNIFSFFYDTVKVNRLKIDGAKFRLAHYKGEKTNIISGKKSDLVFKNFYTNENRIKYPSQIFYSDEMLVNINKYNMELSDDVHSVEVENLSANTASQGLEAKGVRIYPTNEDKMKKAPQLLNLFLPDFSIAGLDFNEIYYDRIFEIDTVLIPSPEVAVLLNNLNQKRHKKENGINLYSLFSDHLDKIQISKVLLQEGDFALNRKKEDSSLNLIKAEKFNLTLNDLLLDSARAENPQNILFADNIDLSVKSLLSKLSGGKYLLSGKDVHISTAEQILSSKDARLLPANPEKGSLSFSSPFIKMKKVDYEKAYYDREISIGSISVPTASFTHNLTKERKSGNEGLTKFFDEVITSVSIENTQIDNGTVNLYYREEGKDSLKLYTTDKVFTKVTDLYLDKNWSKKGWMEQAKDYVVELRDYKRELPDGLYTLEASAIGLSTGNNSLYADSLSVLPRYGKYSFSRQGGFEKDRIEFQTKTIKLNNVAIEKLLSEQSLLARELLVDGASIKVFRDKSLPFDESQQPPMPQDFLRNMDHFLHIDSVKFTNGYIEYEELVEHASRPGKIFFSDLEAKLGPLTNDPILLGHNITTEVLGSAKFMGTGNLNVQILMYPGDTTNYHIYRGSLDQMEMEDINPMLEHVAFVKIKKGNAKKIVFSITADEEFAQGTMRFNYEDLRVALLDKKTGTSGNFGKKIMSLLANLYVKNSNKQKKEDETSLRIGEIYYERDKKRSIINYWTKTLLNGFKYSVGI